jgi:predicted metal-binding membrane protein
MSWSRVQDNRVLATLLTVLTALAWWALWRGEQSAWGHALLHGRHAAHLGFNPLAMGAIFVLGWTLMTVAMMLPTSSPLILLFHKITAGKPHATALVGLLISGYLSVWALFALVAHVLNLAAASVALLAEHAWLTGAAILLVAGLYQFSPLKYACLDKCRSPMLFLAGRWSGTHPARDALRLGLELGLYCVGCCWSLMLVMFAVSTNSLVWMLVLGIVMAVEKNLPWGRRLSAPVGVLLVTAAVAVAIVHF